MSPDSVAGLPEPRPPAARAVGKGQAGSPEGGRGILRLVMGRTSGAEPVAHQGFPGRRRQTQNAMGKLGIRVGRESRHLKPQLTRQEVSEAWCDHSASSAPGRDGQTRGARALRA